MKQAQCASGKDHQPILAVVTDAIAPFHSGGKETRTWHYSQELAQSGFDVHVYTMKWWSGPSTITQGEVRLHALCRRWPLYVNGRRSVAQACFFALACLRLLTARFDVVEVDQIPILPLITVKVVGVLRRKPVIATWHEYWGRDYWVDYLGSLGIVAAALERLALRLPDRLIAVSESTANRIRPVVAGNTPVWLGLNGVDAEVISATAATSPGTDLIYVGRLLSHKGVDVLLRAIARLRDNGCSASLCVVGTGPEEASLRELADQLNIGGRIEFTGELPTHSAVISRIKAAKVMVFPSRREGFGMVVVEAMACGTPVITTSHVDNAARYLVTDGHNGYLCRPDGSDLAEVIVSALDQRAELSVHAKNDALRYTWSESVRRCSEAYSPAPRVRLSSEKVGG